MNATLTDDTRSAVSAWLATLQEALSVRDAGRVSDLFRADGSWRDVLAVSGQIRTCDGPAAIRSLLTATSTDAAQ
jgi:putative flavoprotein involved in K+ transport